MPILRYFVTREMGLAKIYPYTKFDISIASPVPDLRKGVKIQFSVHGPSPRPFLGYFVTLEMGLAKFYPCTEFKVSSFIRSKFSSVSTATFVHLLKTYTHLFSAYQHV